MQSRICSHHSVSLNYLWNLRKAALNLIPHAWWLSVDVFQMMSLPNRKFFVFLQPNLCSGLLVLLSALLSRVFIIFMVLHPSLSPASGIWQLHFLLESSFLSFTCRSPFQSPFRSQIWSSAVELLCLSPSPSLRCVILVSGKDRSSGYLLLQHLPQENINLVSPVHGCVLRTLCETLRSSRYIYKNLTINKYIQQIMINKQSWH